MGKKKSSIKIHNELSEKFISVAKDNTRVEKALYKQKQTVKVPMIENGKVLFKFISMPIDNTAVFKKIALVGNYNPLLVPIQNQSDKYHFSASACYLLSLVSEIPISTIANAVVQKRKIGQYRPFYKASEGGGGITLGTKTYKTITYTENFFSTNQEKYKGNAFGEDINTWLEISSHEVRHLPQIDEAGGLIKYLLRFIGEYVSSGSHNGAPSEISADIGSYNFKEFVKFINKTYGQNSLENLLRLNKSEEYKISYIASWWQDYKKK